MSAYKPSSSFATHRSAANLFLVVGALGLVARLALITRSIGSNDMLTWGGFAQSIADTGLGQVYETNAAFNHPPLMGLLAAALRKLAVQTHVRFETLFKLPQVLADALVAALLYRNWRPRGSAFAAAVFALFCWNPTSFLISAYHGNTDSLCAAMALLAAVLLDGGRPLAGGLALGGAINVKLIPVLLIPVLFSTLRGWKNTGRFVSGLSIGTLPFLPILLFHQKAFTEHVLGYNSFPGYWGFTAFFATWGYTPRLAALGGKLCGFWINNGAAIAIGASCCLAAANLWKRRRWGAREIGAGAFAAFLIVTPGFGIQYIVYPVPLLFAASVQGAVIYSTVAGLYAALVYIGMLTSLSPLFSDFTTGMYAPAAQIVGYVTWAILVRTLVQLWKARQPPPSRVPRSFVGPISLAADRKDLRGDLAGGAL